VSRRHGRATIPFGKRYRGIRVSLCPDDYLSFLTTLDWIKLPEWEWLFSSVVSELRHRGFHVDGIDYPEDVGAEPSKQLNLTLEEKQRLTRMYKLEDAL